MKIPSSAYEYLTKSKAGGGSKKINEIPEIDVYGTRPKMKLEELAKPVKSKKYTPSGGGKWTFYEKQGKWVNDYTGATLSIDEYEKKYPHQLRQSNYDK